MWPPWRGIGADGAADRRSSFGGDAYSAWYFPVPRVFGRRKRRPADRQPQALASALQKLEYYAKHQSLPAATPATAHMFIVNPLKGGDWLASMFSTHPTTAQRAAKLQELAQRLGR
ncbi:MAG TPA: hypothetical protein VN379_02420 [Sporomusa sp.]|nr:hypothetical protein [Sporomusa sp.]HWR05694.1 hypothetical protein [Sporomusa sp.]